VNDKELRAFNDCMESVAWYNAHGLSVIAEAYLARTETLVNKEK
jgi:hypothetical protein